ncbi:hypothetical protein [Silanimonas sp.]|jgi:hypothetical protein|uniref:hypothetical protein n=1 Tax=Silanimonas sp. TaxID=1929290 RepID=UPI0022CAC91E|nr:hypothetical protein [Silanimonas sp.]MCZ8167105.1 hypothetical protein [Silanimonas sp.]
MKAATRRTSAWALPGTVYALWLLAGISIFVAPVHFHALTPGVALFGPFNAHFIRDVGLVYVASGLVGLYGLRSGSVPVGVAAALWSCLHALFHVHVWIDRGLPLDGIFLFDLSFVIVPPFLVVMVLLASRSQTGTSS